MQGSEVSVALTACDWLSLKMKKPWGDALHQLYVGVQSPRAGQVTLAVDGVQVCSTPHAHVPSDTQLTPDGTV